MLELNHDTLLQAIKMVEYTFGIKYHTSVFHENNLWGPFYKHGLTLIQPWISNYTHYNVWDEITYPFLNFNSATVEV